MEDLTTIPYQKTIVIKAITVGTFVYLPATFVSESILMALIQVVADTSQDIL